MEIILCWKVVSLFNSKHILSPIFFEKYTVGLHFIDLKPVFLNCIFKYNSVFVPYFIIISSYDFDFTVPQSI